MWYNLRGKTDEFYFVENLSMGHFEKGVSTALCVLCLAAGVLLAVLGFGGSYGGGSAGLIFGALIFITVPAVMLFAMYGSEIKTKKRHRPGGNRRWRGNSFGSGRSACVHVDARRAQGSGSVAAYSGSYAHHRNLCGAQGDRYTQKEKMSTASVLKKGRKTA